METNIILFSLMLCVAGIHAQNTVKWCILPNEADKCGNMTQAFKNHGVGTIQCVTSPHEAGCLRMIEDKEADIKSVSDRGIYCGGKYNSLHPIMSEKRTSADAESFFYKAVVVVKKDDGISKIRDIKGKQSCHTGVMRTVGWVVPMGVLYEHAGMELSTANDACENNIKSVAEFFTQSCAPGAFEHYNNPNNDNPENICKSCGSDQCPSNDTYSSYSGAFKGLVDGKCDVAFVKHTTVGDANIPNPGDYRLVCPEGGPKPVSQWLSCNWATRPTPALVTRNDDPSKAQYVRMMEKAVTEFGPSGNNKAEFDMFNSTQFGGKNIMFADKTISLAEIAETYDKHLGEGFYNSYEKFRPSSCPKNLFRWCVISDLEMKKCREFSAALAGRRITQHLTCVQATNPDACMKLIQDGRADTVTVDGGHVFTGGKYFNLKPIMAEVYSPTGDDTSYYAVAVTTNKALTLAGLQGKKTCHTGFERTSGWNVPVGYFASGRGITIDPKTCNTGAAAASFFGDMCVPGALEKEYNHGQNNPKKMCALCPNNCAYRGMYNGYTGAIRCMLEKNGDVAFVKHTTIDDVYKNPPAWAAGKNRDDFVLLCPDGTTKPVNEYLNCNLARVPSHAVLAKKDLETKLLRHYQIALDRSQLKYGVDANGKAQDSFFNMFKSVGGSNLLFKDSTKKLKIVTKDYKGFLGDQYFQVAEAMDSRKCYVGSSNSIKYSFTATAIAVMFSFIW